MPTSRLIAIIIACCLLSSLLCVKLFSTGNVAESPRETTFERIQRTRELNCGYLVVASLLRKDEKTGQLSGPGFDIVNAMAKNLKLNVKWSAEVGTASIAEDLKTGRFDMLCTPITAASAARGQVMSVSRKVFFTPSYLYVHPGETRSMADLSWVNDPSVKLSTIDGLAYTSLYAHYFPRAKVVSLPELSPISDMMLQVSTGKVDATLMLKYDAALFLQTNPGRIKQGSSNPIVIGGAGFWMPKDDGKMKGMIDTALDEMIYNGAIDNILDRYEPTRGKYYWRVAPEYQMPAQGGDL